MGHNMKNTIKPFSVGILAGGKSTRMGQNKALMEFQNETMIGRISREFSQLGEVLVSASSRGLYEAEGVHVVYDEEREIGPIEGIRQLVRASGEEYIFICAADMPFIRVEIAKYIAEFISSDYDCYVVADEERVHPLCAIYSKKILPVIEELIRDGKYKLMGLLNRVRTKYISLEHTNFDRRVLRNVNTKDEFLRLSLPYVFAVSGYKNSGKTWLIEKLINEFIRCGYSVGVLKHDGKDHIEEAEGTDTARHKRAGANCTLVFSDTQYVLTACEVRIKSGISETIRQAGKCDTSKSADRNTGNAGTISFADEENQCSVLANSSYVEQRADHFIEEIKRLPDSPDIIILEGFKKSKYPKVEIVRSTAVPHSVADPATLICISTDILAPEEVSCPVYGLDDVQGIFSCIREFFSI